MQTKLFAKYRNSLLSGLVLFGLTGCTLRAAPEIELAYSPLTQRWPVTVALDYRNGFTEYIETGEMTKVSYGMNYRVEAGPPSAYLVERVTRSMFRDIVILRDDAPVESLRKNVALIIQPAVEKFSVSRIQDSITITAVYRFKTLTPEGHLIDDWGIEKSRQTGIGWGRATNGDAAFKYVMEDAIAEFAGKWGCRQSVSQWLIAHATYPDNPTPQTSQGPTASPDNRSTKKSCGRHFILGSRSAGSMRRSKRIVPIPNSKRSKSSGTWRNFPRSPGII
jgi:hypothetical protein